MDNTPLAGFVGTGQSDFDLSPPSISAFAGSASAQNGFALKGHYIINSSAAEEAQESRQLPEADAFGLGAECVLPFGIGIGFLPILDIVYLTTPAP